MWHAPVAVADIVSRARIKGYQWGERGQALGVRVVGHPLVHRQRQEGWQNGDAVAAQRSKNLVHIWCTTGAQLVHNSLQ